PAEPPEARAERDEDQEDGAHPISLAVHRFATLTREVFGCQWVHLATVDTEAGRYRAVSTVEQSPEGTPLRRRLFEGGQLEEYFTPEQCTAVAAGRVIMLDATSNPQLAQAFGMSVSSAIVAPLFRAERLIGLLAL